MGIIIRNGRKRELFFAVSCKHKFACSPFMEFSYEMYLIMDYLLYLCAINTYIPIYFFNKIIT